MSVPAEAARQAVVDLMVIGEIMQAIGTNGSDPADSDQVPSSHVEWLGKQVSDLAADHADRVG